MFYPYCSYCFFIMPFSLTAAKKIGRKETAKVSAGQSLNFSTPLTELYARTRPPVAIDENRRAGCGRGV